MGALLIIDFTSRWTTPVFVGLGDQLDTTIAGPADAIRYMRVGFTVKRGPAYWRAQSICYHALLRQADLELARHAFVDAWMDQALADFADEG